MDKSKIEPRVLELLGKLEKKFDSMGQDLSSYLDGLLYSDYLTYWDYIHLDTLLSLQNPRTGFPDEKIFIMYHQITELYFNLIIHEIKQIQDKEDQEKDWFLKRIRRVNRYFNHLVDSFDIMVDGMDQEQFLAFRMSLLPASGFQSVQYREIEIMSTDFRYLTKTRKESDGTIPELFEDIYWRMGATELASGKKTLTLRQFEAKYSERLIKLGEEMKHVNLYRLYRDHFDEDDDIRSALREFDGLANVNWPLVHYKSAVRYLNQDPIIISATGGTNWQKYLPPRFQKVSFYPGLWSEKEMEEWGKGWVIDTLAQNHA